MFKCNNWRSYSGVVPYSYCRNHYRIYRYLKTELPVSGLPYFGPNTGDRYYRYYRFINSRRVVLARPTVLVLLGGRCLQEKLPRFSRLELPERPGPDYEPGQDGDRVAPEEVDDGVGQPRVQHVLRGSRRPQNDLLHVGHNPGRHTTVSCGAPGARSSEVLLQTGVEAVDGRSPGHSEVRGGQTVVDGVAVQGVVEA